MKKTISLLLSLLLLVSLVSGCQKNEPAPTDAPVQTSAPTEASDAATVPETTEPEAQKYPFTFRDSLGTEHTLEKPLAKIIVLNRQTAEAVKILGGEDRVIATGDTTVQNNPYLGFNDLPDMGKTKELNMEAIISLQPDAVFIHTNRATEVLEEKLNPLGVHVIRIDNYQPEKYDEEMRLLGQLLDAEDRAEEFLAYRHNIEEMTAQRISQLPEEEKKTVMALSVGFMNSKGGYRVFPAMASNGEMGVGEGYATILAGGKDACPDILWDPTESGTTVQVDEEYALSAKPQVITLHGTWLGGYNCTDPKDYQDVIDNIYSISSIGQTPAGENREVYVFHTDMLGAAKRHIGVLQLGKYLYPDLFQDIDAEKYAQEYFRDWLGTDYQGIWFYSAKTGK